MAKIARICRYPVKGMSPEPLPRISVQAGEGLPLDRKLALARPRAPFDPEQPTWLAKRHFLMLMTDERLASFRVGYDDDTARLTVDRAGRREVNADVRTPAGRDAIERFFEHYMSAELRGRPRLVSAAGHMFTDNPEKYLSLINLASVAELGHRLGQSVDPLRFRAKLYVDGLPACGVRLVGPRGRGRRGQVPRRGAHRSLRRDQRRPGKRPTRPQHSARVT
jgi:uncharacterized protein YcbX